ncbi:peptide-methionine (S)-S-oxide reductase [Microbulbifer magnicolonia]|uniref:peptide-methionine (S)-S-oxide reductase n=1 Tax=Microbulbifer magnicolonia TaxID=3109744 RepID=UPI002B417C2F|nr:peptide-methionine (S)-S-oxide reductase [Microbulbifer sp. GG15]
MSKLERIGLGGGCHWCTEAVFQALRGVRRVEPGYIASASPHNGFSEAVIVHYHPDEISLEVLIGAHLHTHASRSRHALREKYRSAIYTFSESQAAAATSALQSLQAEFDADLVTQVLPFSAFKDADARFHNYYASDPQRPYCQTYIEPKLRRLRARYGDAIRN